MIKKIKEKISAKIIFLSLGGLLVTFLFWAATRKVFSFAFASENFENFLFLMGAALILFVITLSWHGILSFLVRKKWSLIFVLFFTQGGYLFLFGGHILGWTAYLVLVFSLWLWAFRSRKDFSTRSKVMPLRSMNFGLKTTITIFLIVISFSFYLQTHTEVTDEELIVSLRDFSVGALERVFSLQLREFSPEMSFREVVLENAGNGVLGNYLTGGVKSDQVNQVVINTLREKYQERFKISFESSDSIHSILSQIAEKRIRNYFDTYSQYIPYALVAVVFLGLKIFTLLYFWLVKLFSFLFFQTLLKSGFIRIVEKKAKIEKLQI